MEHSLNAVLGGIVLFLGILAIVEWSLTYGLVLSGIGLVQSGLGAWLYQQQQNRR
jgi:hypothetical protein